MIDIEPVIGFKKGYVNRMVQIAHSFDTNTFYIIIEIYLMIYYTFTKEQLLVILNLKI